ncbi:voltage-gated potassium channel [Verrucomicrobium sp. GAS474]|uniref:ion transporter n=1 Tax=Verrucomicrobium sp. GAS474 TaxID=1882831 RepID=UPI00087B0453|nr:ion transporter [Verrucomicrobium sp. GAS474]SDT86047.1 voltage-gated potassium channel [Verrucomicrobium sp. GAS474]
MIHQANKSELTREGIGFFDLFVFLLSLYVIAELVAESLLDLDRELLKLLQKIDFAVCLIFLYDFALRFIKAPNKLKFMRWGWIDLVSSIPAWNGFFVGRALRIFRLLRLIRAYRSFQSLISHLFKNVPQGTLTSLIIVTFFLILFSSIAVLSFERDSPGSNIRSAGDALWWTMTTITTVGYGDHYPVSLEGRIVAVLLMVAGAGIFGTFTAVVSSMFIRTPKKVPAEIEEQLVEIRQLLEELKAQKQQKG